MAGMNRELPMGSKFQMALVQGSLTARRVCGDGKKKAMTRMVMAP
jgi:hypothetical protein